MEGTGRVDNPEVYVGEQTGAMTAVFCEFGRQIAHSKPGTLRDASFCTSTYCVCRDEENDSFRPATPKEAADFWEGLRQLADAALYEIQHDL
jgi:hypothetical protein